ncbi:type II toxin-antitoxin system RelE/ParE family toxin [Polynucleobacter sp. UB-Raua-W9]|uniref:type II toxin-antitoxin system RelE/ParE family toxin n=1 Tax=Polynucleobacter sp. UB-Raua-W9 TaxID=1819736 RepID=UPI001BFCFDDE|nr:type II toxin-antitoxin system RelE/ParE family toxin [Polynucleobacter sp. UB-Raua-W9]QWD72685.1 type II toxin-antitoxin system RelE/ParE family toxin [Polynucleobacter sp. UB-Raua-W9]
MAKKRVLKTKTFTKWMNKNDLQDNYLLRAVREMEDGLIDADLGNHVYKKRIALTGGGKRSGARVMVASRLLRRWFFIFGYAKNEKSNISNDELLYLQEAAKRLLNLADREIDIAISDGELKELKLYDQ